ncbi:CoA transferase [Streptomyces sp. NPDC059378]|uniref:CoA transferase n=1 Tax=Streptomyces sp. NPDC059378 TaxID=3346815 RepID=UPI003679FC7B
MSPDRTAPPGALSGIVVADFGRVLAAPYLTMLLAGRGGAGVEIERPGSGDETRAGGPADAAAGGGGGPQPRTDRQGP